MLRIEYAWNVAQTRNLFASAPGDLDATGQMGMRGTSSRSRRPWFSRPAANAGAPRLAEADFLTAAATVGPGAEVSAVMAAAQVEAGGRHRFAPDGRPIIRYELHIFHNETGGPYDRTAHLSQPTLAAGNPFHVGGQPTMKYAVWRDEAPSHSRGLEVGLLGNVPGDELQLRHDRLARCHRLRQ